MIEYLQKIEGIDNDKYLFLKFVSSCHSSYRRSQELLKNDEEVAICKRIMKEVTEHFKTDQRFNLPNQPPFQVSLSYYRYNDKEIMYSINYLVRLGKRDRPDCRGCECVCCRLEPSEEFIEFFKRMEKQHAQYVDI